MAGHFQFSIAFPETLGENIAYHPHIIVEHILDWGAFCILEAVWRCIVLCALVNNEWLQFA